jgi:hypothetical protein
MRSWILKAVVSLGSLLLCVGIAELVVRSLSDQTLGFRYDTAKGRFSLPEEFQLNRSPNSLGFHDVEPEPKAEGRLQVMLLGDSYVESYSVHAKHNVGQRIQHHLEGSGVSAQVISIGKSSWGQRDELDALHEYGRQIAPDVVVTLFLPLNDVENNSPKLRNQTKLQHLDPELMFRPGWARRAGETMPFFWFERSVLNQLISHRLALNAMGPGSRGDASIPVDYFVYATDPDEDWQAAWAATEQLVVETAEQAKALGSRYAVASASTPQGVLGPEAGLEALVASYPAMKGRNWDLLLPARRMAEICRRNKIPFIALEPPMREVTESGLRLHWRYDGHWNGEGNDVAGALLAEFIASEFVSIESTGASGPP